MWHDEAPEGKLDLLLTLDFRMTSTTIFSDVVLPAATWYEKHDLNTTDMHPFVHSFNPAIAPPWQTRTDWDAFQTIADGVQPSSPSTHLGVRRDVVAVPLLHDTPDAMANPHGVVARLEGTASASRCPGVTMPKLVVVERDYAAVGDEDGARSARCWTRSARPPRASPTTSSREVDYLRAQERRGPRRRRPTAGRRWRATSTPARRSCALSGTTNGHLATQGFQTLEKRTGSQLADLAAEHEGKQITFADTQAAPVPVITSPEWSGSETGGRRYSPFTINVERLKPWHTLTGRQHFYLDHDWMTELGEGLPVYRPPLNMTALFGEPAIGEHGRARGHGALPDPAQQVVDPLASTRTTCSCSRLSRGGQTIWMSDQDAAKVGVARQRLDRGGQPQRRRRRPGDRLAPDARGHRLHAPRPGPADRRAARRDDRASAAASTTR